MHLNISCQHMGYNTYRRVSTFESSLCPSILRLMLATSSADRLRIAAPSCSTPGPTVCRETHTKHFAPVSVLSSCSTFPLGCLATSVAAMEALCVER